MPSRCPLGGLGKGQATKIVSRLGRLAAGCKERPLVGLQKLNPVGNISRAPEATVKTKFRTQERSAQFRNQFLGRVVGDPNRFRSRRDLWPDQWVNSWNVVL